MDLHRYPNYGYLRLQSNMAIIHIESAYNEALLETGSKISLLESGRTLALLESRCTPSLTHNGSETHRKIAIINLFRDNQNNDRFYSVY